MSKEKMVQELFKTIDNLDTKKFVSFLTDDAIFRLGNAEAATGKGTVETMVSGFFDSINGMRHEIYEVWEHPNTVICQGNVTYIRKDSTELSVPFANILRLENDLIKEYLVYVDISELFKMAIS
ncbi:MAG: nuclear transport factor 2 family protein [candidate division Zixibacteria bacterium]|nr:nuclear transport factor 2 family protein [candidate division Zixibacteria bacterium]